MTSPNRRELDDRLLAEARSRADGRVLRRFLLLLAVAFLVGAYGLQSGSVPALGMAAVCAVVAMWSVIRG